MTSPDFNIAVASDQDAAFLRDMGRHATTLEDRPLPAPDAEEVAELFPTHPEHAVVAVSTGGRRLGAAWTLVGGPALVGALPAAPEVCMAVEADSRNQGVGKALLEELIKAAGRRGHPDLVLNVHLRNTAALRLYMRCGFRVAGAGRGWFGVAMSRAAGGRD